MSKPNSWADRTKSALSTVDTSNLKPVDGGNLEKIVRYYQTSDLRPNATPLAAKLNVGDEILGVYAGNFVTKKFNTTYYKVRTQDGLVAVPGSGQLNKLMSKVAEGAEVKISYKGKETIEKGPMAGKQAHSFFVAASELKA